MRKQPMPQQVPPSPTRSTYYAVTVEVEVEAWTPEQAALLAEEAIRNHHDGATAFEVRKLNAVTSTIIDITDLLEDT